mmetsp:Transcript_21853/g.47717  ORF Transcript_21853/g.47717 Transcript_21853/m.47717 type:complete len:295 (-) Transcript_21853:606-1490(-)
MLLLPPPPQVPEVRARRRRKSPRLLRLLQLREALIQHPRQLLHRPRLRRGQRRRHPLLSCSQRVQPGSPPLLRQPRTDQVQLEEVASPRRRRKRTSPSRLLLLLMPRRRRQLLPQRQRRRHPPSLIRRPTRNMPRRCSSSSMLRLGPTIPKTTTTDGPLPWTRRRRRAGDKRKRSNSTSSRLQPMLVAVPMPTASMVLMPLLPRPLLRHLPRFGNRWLSTPRRLASSLVPRVPPCKPLRLPPIPSLRLTPRPERMLNQRLPVPRLPLSLPAPRSRTYERPSKAFKIFAVRDTLL